MELVEHFLAFKMLRPQSQKKYESVVALWIKDNGDSIIKDVTRHSAIEWRTLRMSRDKIAASTWNNNVRHLRAIWNVAIDFQYADTNPFKKMTIAAQIRKKRTISPAAVEMVRRLLEGSKRQHDPLDRLYPAFFWEAVFETFYQTGMRLSQLLGLKWSDINFEADTILLRAETSKTHREWPIPIAAKLRPILFELQERTLPLRSDISELNVFNPCLFMPERYSLQGPTTSQILGIFEYLSDCIGVTISPHRLRHTIATELMVEPERNVLLVKELLGHTVLSTTMLYVSTPTEAIRNLIDQRGGRSENNTS